MQRSAENENLNRLVERARRNPGPSLAEVAEMLEVGERVFTGRSNEEVLEFVRNR